MKPNHPMFPLIATKYYTQFILYTPISYCISAILCLFVSVRLHVYLTNIFHLSVRESSDNARGKNKESCYKPQANSVIDVLITL